MMKKNIFMITSCIMMLSISSVAYSAPGPYMSVNVGVAILNDSDVTDSTEPGLTMDMESDSGLALGVAVGYAVAGNMRFEGEFAYQENDLDNVSFYGIGTDLTGDTASYAFLLNGYYDFKNTSAFTPFISGGVGMVQVEINNMNFPGSDDPDVSDDDTVFAYQFGAGVAYAVNEQISIDVKYRYFGTSDPEFETTEVEYSSNNIYAGVRIAF
ncbi:porin family protein [Desulforhopalus vacuolatus]|uniref:outer membrane protein n=1 Tax=Desulforhopalus vacuolatus TaxID=40414 RepID=UPI0019656622|nr:outer membrane beta-barrel protein [Desulforhopalus vacuolatus]MBM9518971.1 porin family protein [Desulforhopalus vacuolatus]